MIVIRSVLKQKSFFTLALFVSTAIPSVAQFSERYSQPRKPPRLTTAGHVAARSNVGCENLVDAGDHRPRPRLARFAIVMNPIAASFSQDVARKSTRIDHWIAPPNRLLDQPVDPILHL